MGRDSLSDYNPVVSNWAELKQCLFAEKHWVHPGNVDEDKEYEKGDFLRVWCGHDQCWCSATSGPSNCAIFVDHENE